MRQLPPEREHGHSEPHHRPLTLPALLRWAARQLDLTGAENTNAWAGKLQTAVEDLSLTTDAQSEFYYFVTERTLVLDSERAIRLQLALPEIPLAIWLVILVCTFAFIVLLTIHLGVTWARGGASASSRWARPRWFSLPSS